MVANERHMTMSQTSQTYRIARRAGKQGARTSVEDQAGVNENATGINKLTRCKKILRISTLNTRTLNGVSKLNEMVAHAEKQKLSIVCIQEHRLYHSDIDLKYEEVGKGWTFITSSAWKNTQNSTIGGIGILLSPYAMKSLNSIETITNRIMIATFNGNPKTTVISCYSPTNASDEADVNDFYQQLSSLINSIPKHNLKMICGDMNAKVGTQNSKILSFNRKSNRNGKLLLDMIEECELVLLNTKFQKRIGKLWTFTYPNGQKSQLDYILVNRKWINSVMNCETYSSFQSINSDHRIVTAEIRLSLRANKAKQKEVPHDWSKLRTDEGIKMTFTVEVKNRFDALQDMDEERTTETLYSNIMAATRKAMEEYIPKKVRNKKRTPWEDVDIQFKREVLKSAYQTKAEKPTEENILLLDIAKKDLNDTYIRKQELFIQQKTQEIENASEHHKSRMAWIAVNEITGRKSSNRGKLKADNPDERLDKWRNHFQGLLGEPPDIKDEQITVVVPFELPIDTNEFTLSELEKAINLSSNNKATGIDTIPAEVWKTGILNEPLLDICNRTINGSKPSVWSKSEIIPFPKKGDLGLAKNYRGISLTCISAKIYNKMLLLRIQPHLEPILRENQNGFRPGRSTIAQILTLRRLIEGIKSKNLNAVLTFVDFRKAFDSIHRVKMFDILKAYGIPSKIIEGISIMYQNTDARVRSPDGDTDFFKIHAGVLQGDTLAPFLFIIVLDYVMRKTINDHEKLAFTLTERRSRRHPASIISDIDYADDIALISSCLNDAQELLQRVEQAAEEVGLHINADKTECMTFKEVGSLRTLEGIELKNMTDFLYLGSWIDNSEKDIKTRKAKAWSALNKMDTIWKSDMKKELKVKFFRATVESVLMYGAETWTLNKKLERELDGCYTRMLRVVNNVTWKDHMSNKVLYGNLPQVTATLRERRIRFIGHIWRSKNELASKLLLWDPKQGKRSRGRPAITYIDQLESDTGLYRNELPQVMQDREQWKEIVKRVRVRSTR